MELSNFSPILSLRRSLKRVTKGAFANDSFLNSSQSPAESTAPLHHRAYSVKRLPFSTIKSATDSDKKIKNQNESLPNSPKFPEEKKFFNRSNYKTSSFHYYKRYSYRDDDNIGLFLEALENAIKSINEKKQQFLKEIEGESSNKRLVDEKSLGFYCNGELQLITNEEKEQLYCETIYTIKHKIGRTIDGHTDFIIDLYKYAQEAFRMTADDHERLFQLTSEEKPPILMLICEVIDAVNLEAKDPNGFSDPYCMLGIIPGNRTSQVEDKLSENDFFPSNLSKMPTVQNFNSPQNPPVAQKSSLIKRFSSFRRSEKVNTNNNNNNNLTANKDSNLNKNKSIPNSNLKLSGIIRDKLPAKYIQTTDVKKATLNPVWKQKFTFQIDDIKSDTFHLDIWDHDDESSVFEAAKKLNEVKGLKGLDRYFKQIAQSARTNKEDNVDDFLGSVNIRLDDLPSNGIEKWYELEGRTEKSNVEGKIRLRLKLATKEDRGNVEGNGSNELKQQEKILRIFIQHELFKLNADKNSEWRGELSREAETILHQHSIQGDMNDFQIAISRWIAFCKSHLEKELSYKLLLSKLENLEKVWNSSSPSREETSCLKESFDLFIKHCFKLIANLRECFPITENRLGLEKLEYVLKILNKIFNMNAFKYCFPFQNSLLFELVSVIKNASIEWFDQTYESFFRKSEDDNLKKLIDFTQLIYLDLLMCQRFYDPIFKNELNVDYYSILYKKIDSKLVNTIEKTLVEEFGEDVKKFPTLVSNIYGQIINVNSNTSNDSIKIKKEDSNSSQNPANVNTMLNYVTITEQISVELFELYSLLHIIYRMKSYLSDNDQSCLNLSKFYELFYMPYKRWIDLIKKRTDNKIEKCFDYERNDVLTELTKVSSSSIEISNILSQINRIWKLIHWPDFVGAQMFFIEIIDCLSKAITRYIIQTSSWKNLQNSQSSLNSNQNLSVNKPYLKCGSELDFYQRLIITTNNLEKVRESFKLFFSELEFDKYQSIAEKQDKLQLYDLNKAKLESLINNTCEFNIQIIEQCLEVIVINKIIKELDPHMFYLFESPESATAKESISRIIEYLDSNFRVYKDLAYKSNYEMFLKVQWIKLLDEIEIYLNKDNTRSQIFFNKMHECLDLLTNYFNSENQAVPIDFLCSVEKFKQLKKYLNFSRMETQKLIQLYYQEMVEFQNSQRFGEYGKLICRACYHSKEEILAIEILKCKNLLPMDQNGLSDPYVEIDLKPKCIFVSNEKQTTSVVKKTLNPVYNETFEFKISEKYLSQIGNVIHFTVMDHDFVWTNDFEGEAFLELVAVPRLKGESGEVNYKDLKYLELILIRPKDSPSKIIDVLEYRKDQDKLAFEFLKDRRDKLKI